MMDFAVNIFYLDHNPRFAAQALVDKHIVKMPTETLQLISTAHRLLDGVPVEKVVREGAKPKIRYTMADEHFDHLLYKVTHQNHPSAVWARTNTGNYAWLIEYLNAMCEEYRFRYKNTFKCVKFGMVAAVQKPPRNLPRGDFFPPTLAMPEIYKGNDPIESYRRYYAGDKWRFAKWKETPMPKWMLPNMAEVWHDLNFEKRVEYLRAMEFKKNPPCDLRILQRALELTREVDSQTVS